jgi:hypothetical protein
MYAAAGFAVSWVSYRVGLRKGLKTERQPEEPKPVCGCGHHYASHNEQGVCQVVTTKQVLVERGEPRTVQTGYHGMEHKVVYDREVYEKVVSPCACTRYTGPEPLPTYIS